MKNKYTITLIIGILILSIVLIPIIKAEANQSPGSSENNPSTPSDTPNPKIPGGDIDPATGLPKSYETAKNIGEKVADEQQRNEFLKTEYQKVYNDSKTFKPLFNAYKNYASPILNPIMEFLTGMKPAISWLFFLAAIIWIFLAIYSFNFTSGIKSKYTHYLVFLVIIVPLSFFGVAGRIANLIVGYVSKAGSQVVQLIIITAIILVFIIVTILSKQISGIATGKTIQKTLEEGRSEQDMQMLEKLRKKIIENNP